jgi:hypothetical protein
MLRPCCQRPVAKVIKVGTFEAGIIGFEGIMKDLAESELSDEQELANQLLVRARKYGNYISSITEKLYEQALLREFRLSVGKGAQAK